MFAILFFGRMEKFVLSIVASVKKNLFCGYFVFFLSCDCFAFMHVCLYVPFGHLLGKS